MGNWLEESLEGKKNEQADVLHGSWLPSLKAPSRLMSLTYTGVFIHSCTNSSEFFTKTSCKIDDRSLMRVILDNSNCFKYLVSKTKDCYSLVGIQKHFLLISASSMSLAFRRQEKASTEISLGLAPREKL